MPTPPKLIHAPMPASHETPGQRLAVSTDDQLQPPNAPNSARKTRRAVLQRLERIQTLPAHPRTTVRKCLDLMPKSVAPALLDRLPADQGNAAVRFLEFRLLEDEEISKEEEAAVARSKEWFKNNEGITFEELVADLGFSMEEVRNGGQHPAV